MLINKTKIYIQIAHHKQYLKYYKLENIMTCSQKYSQYKEIIPINFKRERQFTLKIKESEKQKNPQ